MRFAQFSSQCLERRAHRRGARLRQHRRRRKRGVAAQALVSVGTRGSFGCVPRPPEPGARWAMLAEPRARRCAPCQRHVGCGGGRGRPPPVCSSRFGRAGTAGVFRCGITAACGRGLTLRSSADPLRQPPSGRSRPWLRLSFRGQPASTSTVGLAQTLGVTQTPTATMRRISAFSSRFTKRHLPWLVLISVSFAVAVNVARNGIEPNIEGVVLLVVAALFVGLYRWGLGSELADEVFDLGEHLLIRRGTAEVRVPLSSIEKVDGTALVNPEVVTLHLSHRTELGKLISFIPSGLGTGLPGPHRLAAELMARAQTAREKGANASSKQSAPKAGDASEETPSK